MSERMCGVLGDVDRGRFEHPFSDGGSDNASEDNERSKLDDPVVTYQDQHYLSIVEPFYLPYQACSLFPSFFIGIVKHRSNTAVEGPLDKDYTAGRIAEWGCIHQENECVLAISKACTPTTINTPPQKKVSQEKIDEMLGAGIIERYRPGQVKCISSTTIAQKAREGGGLTLEELNIALMTNATSESNSRHKGTQGKAYAKMEDLPNP
ncbi:hypothetical protein K435DRAFT_855638 [Dendrothele bispora CBS 962.96]|uniref:Uncharacterized protein n=1 Tax=Dendrothele bispora (strain CBS 962.96) TaxID=1314807 RepID=A0A4S8MAH2_DENBC|nr:hypothetical protein K435DRAFT_855638 [Dendrothele bispora CBS 962.96]